MTPRPSHKLSKYTKIYKYSLKDNKIRENREYMRDARGSKRQFIVYTETAKMVIARVVAIIYILGLCDACSWIPKVEQQDFCSAHFGKYYRFILRFNPIIRNNLTATDRHKLIK